MDTHSEPGTVHQLPSRIAEGERREVIELFNATQIEYPKKKLIHQLFEEQADRAPDAVAVVYEGQSLTYAELNARANQLAWYLKDEGVEIGENVPVYMRRSLAMLVAQLAVLKVGGVYVPIDPELPRRRRDFMIRDCGASRIITDNCASRPPDLGAARQIDWTAPTPHSGTSTAGNLNLLMDPVPRAYLMYTSGSTGEPKGVVVPHHAVVRLVINSGYADINSTDCFAHCSNPAFDASTFEIFGALLNGARVVILPQSIVLEGERFAATLRMEHVTILFMSVGLFNRYTDVLADVFSQLRYLITGGDVLDPQAIRRVLEASPPEFLLNAYGPTECTTFATTHLIKAVDKAATSIPIGRPIANTQVYILGAGLEPVPIGAVGELYIGGDGVALGYLNRPALTAERFLSDPFSADPKARMYKTGDLGRWRADGTIEFLGRDDNQVKVRGYRIELAEIEAQLTRHPAVKEAAVLAREDGTGEKRLVAYVVWHNQIVTQEFCLPSSDRRQEPVPPHAVAEVQKSEPPCDTSISDVLGSESRRELIPKLAEHLRDCLPAYMVPSAFVVLKQLPLTPNGKLDRLALPAPPERPEEIGEYVAPGSDLERLMADTWAQVLRLDQVGKYDNFFELGGNSLLAIRVIAEVRERIGIDAALKTLYDLPTLSAFAGHVEAIVREQYGAEVESGVIGFEEESSADNSSELVRR